MTTIEKPLILRAKRMMGRPITEHSHFAMVEMAALEGMSDLVARAPKAAQLILLLIREMSAGSSGVVVASRETMRELLDVSMPTVDRALKVLTEEGFVQRIRIGGASALAINSRVAWVGDRGQLRHAVFDATVIASRSEQDEMALNPPPARPVPMLRPGEMQVPVGPGLDPPSQPGLPGVDHPVAFTGDMANRTELESRGQLRIDGAE